MSIDTYYNIYQNNTIDLAYSMIIKLDFIAVAMNRELIHSGIAVEMEKRDWRYYKHLAGEYHFFDDVIKIKSLDDGEEIVYDIENMHKHKRTRSLYMQDRTYIEELIQRYPVQEHLIIGVLYPVDKELAINALDGTILYHDAQYVEKQEYDLIYKVEHYIREYLYTTYMHSYSETDNLFDASVVGLLYTQLFLAIQDIRLSYVKTAQAHSFHISRWLASYGRLDEFIPYLTYEQLLFLYMNIDYISRHTGMSSTFQILLDKLLTLRNLPAFEYRIRQSTIDHDAGELQPTPWFTREPLNLDRGLDGDMLDMVEMFPVIEKELPLADNNYQHLEYYAEQARVLASRSGISNLPTKIMEVSAIDPEDIEPTKLIDVTINEWVYHAVEGSYINAIEVINPVNGDLVKLTSLDAFLLFWFATTKCLNGITMDKITPVHVNNVAESRWLNYDYYVKYVPYKEGDYDDMIDFFVDTNRPLDAPMILSDEFIVRCEELSKIQRTRYQYVENEQRHTDRVHAKLLFNASYINKWCDIDQGRYETYTNFFNAVGIDPSRMDDTMWIDMASDCLNLATGFTNTSTISLRDIQSAMVSIFKRLSSYTIQFIEEIASDDTIITTDLIVLPGDTDLKKEADATVNLPLLEVHEMEASAIQEVYCDLGSVGILSVEIDETAIVPVEVGIDVAFESGGASSALAMLGTVTIMDVETTNHGV